MTADLYRIVYCSRNTILGLSEDHAAQLETILAKSRENNARDGVTGALLYSEGCFAQTLEGPLDAVQQVFERIQCDHRHGEVTVLQAGPAESRLFGAWTMALAAPPDTAGEALQQALLHQDAGADVLALLNGLVSRGEDWLAAA